MFFFKNHVDPGHEETGLATPACAQPVKLPALPSHAVDYCFNPIIINLFAKFFEA